MTLTTPSCPAGSWIYEGVKTALLGLLGATQVNVTLVFDPPWTADMLSDNARRQLGGSPSEGVTVHPRSYANRILPRSDRSPSSCSTR